MNPRTAPCAVWPAAMLLWGPGYVATRHNHHCVQLILAFRGHLRVRGGPGLRWTTCGAALVRPDVFHEVDASESDVLVAFVDAESDLGVALDERIVADITAVPDGTLAAWRRELGDAATLGADRVTSWVSGSLLSGRRMPDHHPGVRRVLRVLREQIGTARDLSLGRLAVVAGLSPSRFMHVFTESVGVPLRPYIRWLRLQVAIGQLVRGTSISVAAHHAGFADAAHLGRTTRRTLGMTPGDLVRRRSEGRAAFARAE